MLLILYSGITWHLVLRFLGATGAWMLREWRLWAGVSETSCLFGPTIWWSRAPYLSRQCGHNGVFIMPTSQVRGVAWKAVCFSGYSRLQTEKFFFLSFVIFLTKICKCVIFFFSPSARIRIFLGWLEPSRQYQSHADILIACLLSSALLEDA